MKPARKTEPPAKQRQRPGPESIIAPRRNGRVKTDQSEPLPLYLYGKTHSQGESSSFGPDDRTFIPERQPLPEFIRRFFELQLETNLDWESYQCLPEEYQEEQSTDPCSIVDKEMFAGYLIEAKEKLEAAKIGFGLAVNWTKITQKMADRLKGKGLQSRDELETLNESLRYTAPPVYNIPYCFHRLKGSATKRWTPFCDFEKNEVRLVQVSGTPAEAVDDMFQHLEDWQFDCAQYLQVARWYALLRTLGPECFNRRIKQLNPIPLPLPPIIKEMLPGILELKPHGSAGIVGQKCYIRESPDDFSFYLEDKIERQTTPTTETELSLLQQAPIGTRVTWTNLAAPEGSSFRNENTYVVGEDLFMSHPWKTGNRQYIECRLAAHTLPEEYLGQPPFSWMPRTAALSSLHDRFVQECRRGEIRPEMRAHIAKHIFISRIEFFEF